MKSLKYTVNITSSASSQNPWIAVLIKGSCVTSNNASCCNRYTSDPLKPKRLNVRKVYLSLT